MGIVLFQNAVCFAAVSSDTDNLKKTEVIDQIEKTSIPETVAVDNSSAKYNWTERSN